VCRNVTVKLTNLYNSYVLVIVVKTRNILGRNYN
jgi:hypothetical protein